MGCFEGKATVELYTTGNTRLYRTEVTIVSGTPTPTPTATPSNRPPKFKSGSSEVTNSENYTGVWETYTAEDPDEDDNVTLTLKTGGDNDQFSIDASGALKFKSPPDYEKPQDVGKNNVYNITVVATDDGSPKKSVEKTVKVTVTDVNEPPVFSDGASTVRTVAENTSGNTAFDSPVGATDQDGDTLTYSISGTAFSIDTTNGQLKTNAKLNYEAKSSYSVQVDVTDNRGGSANIAVTVNVTDVNESPTIGGSTDVSYKENGTTTVATYTATDPEKDKITWTLKSGGDNNRFSINASGALSFASSPDYEKPQDVGKNNVYNITVKATDDGSPKKSAEKSVEVTVTDVNEPPGKPVAPTVTSGGQSSLNVSWSAPSNTGPPITAYGVRYRKGSSGSFTNASHSGTGTTATISGLDAGTSYQVQVRARNAEGWGSWSSSGSGSTTLGAVQGLAVTASDRSLTVTWSAPSGGSPVSKYRLHHRRASDSWPSDAGAVVTSPHTISGLAEGTSYNVRVRACNSSNVCGDWSYDSATTPTSATASLSPSPSGIIQGEWREFTVSSTGGAVDVVANLTQATSAVLHVGSSKSSNPCPGVQNTTVRRSDDDKVYVIGCGTGSSQIVLRLPSGATLATYTVTVALPPKPGKVRNLALTAGNASATANWSAPSGDGSPTGYKVRYKLSTASGWTVKSVTATSKTITGLTNGALYDVGVQACNLGGCGSWVSGTVTPSTDPITPTPTPTPGPCPTTTDIGTLRFRDPKPEYRFNGTWGAPCSGSRPSKLFTFTLPNIASAYDDNGTRRLYYHKHHVVIDLTSKGGLAPRLILQGQGESTDNPESNSSTGHARLGRTLAAGTYTIKATLTDASSTNPNAGMGLIVRVEEGLPLVAHQGDHTGVFFINDTSTLTPAERADFVDTIKAAVTAWNSAGGSGSWPNVKLCEDDCSGNLDGLKVPIRTSPSTACDSIACVAFDLLTGKDDEHKQYPTKMTIEYPALASSGNPGVPDLEYRWTLVPSLHKDPVNGLLGEFPKWFYLPSTILHEFGHVLGLEDLYKTEHANRYTDYLMGDPSTHTTVPDADIRYLKQVYRHHGGRAHR